jgi:hypothetical protein
MVAGPDITDFAEAVAKILGGEVLHKEQFWFINKHRKLIPDKVLALIRWYDRVDIEGGPTTMDLKTGKVTRNPDRNIEKLHILIVLEKGVKLDIWSEYFDVWRKKYGMIMVKNAI